MVITCDFKTNNIIFVAQTKQYSYGNIHFYHLL